MSLELEEESIQQQFEKLLEQGEKLEIKQFLNDQNISDVVDLIEQFPEYQSQIIASMSTHRAASVFKMLDFSAQKEIIGEMAPIKTAELLNELSPDDRTDFMESLPKEVLRDLLKLLNPEEIKITLSLLGYPEDSVGRLMTTDYVYVYAHNTIPEAFNTIRKVAKNSETIDVIYIINNRGELLDDLRIRDLILASPDKTIEDIMDGRVISLKATDDQEYASQVFKMNNRVALPVTDDNNVLLGIVTIDDILWVTNEEFSEDMQKMGGTEALDEPYLDTSIWQLFRKRIVWLVILFLSEMLTATAMAYFNDEIAKATVLAMFIPLIMSTGGNSGSQASTLIIQAMTMDEVKLVDWWRVMGREVVSGLLLGSALALIGFGRIFIWHILMSHGVIEDLYGPHWMVVGLTVSFAILGIVMWGTLAGSMLPMLLKKMGADPAVSSAPFVATLVDVTGIVIYFSVAYFFLKGILL